MKETFDDAFKVFLELLREPEFRDDKIALAKNQVNAIISRRNDNPFEIAFREASKLVYGADSPYARVPEYATVAAVPRQDLLAWHDRFVHPNNIILGVVGDFDPQRMETKLRESLESWPKGPPAPKNQPSFRGPKPGIYFVAKEDVTASTARHRPQERSRFGRSLLPLFEDKKEAVRVRAAAGYLRLESIESTRPKLARKQ